MLRLITSDTTTMRCTAFYRWYLPVWLLQVWFTAVYSGQVNVALNKKYSQSSFRSFDDRRPENAANDNTDGTFRDNNCIRTSSSDDNPWWEVDLGQVYPVLKLTIYGCSGYESHLESSIITVDGRECVRITSMPSRAINISCSSTLYGRTIRISKCPVKNLMMCEFQVWVCEDGTYGTHCLQRCGHCKHNVTCHHINGTCFQGCAPGWTGNMCNQSNHKLHKPKILNNNTQKIC
ncbi:fucolectin-like [Pomacea canaliculata]|uniref:fucolectin-like n=1 Tax=Pomacea canaliculata TaxID=400727 RepID=UPI000D72D424|nr:fucolectin-like [Pomacea canaliculata]